MSDRRLVLVKHGLPEIVESLPSAEWRLSDAGRHASIRLAHKLTDFRFEAIAASSEPKAAATAEAMASVLKLPVAIDAGFVEHQRTTSGFLGREQFEAAIADLLAHPDRLVFGDETGDQAYSRFAAAIERLPRTGDVLVVTHGTVATLYLSRMAGIEPFSFWKALGLSHAAVFADGQVRIVSPD
jgi:broad specificity phosphatase PhoE